MLERLRIYPQCILGGILSLLLLGSLISKITPFGLIAFPFVLASLIGGILALRRKSYANWILLFGSLPPLLFGLIHHFLRIGFIIKYGGMELPDGQGSPLAFLIGWTFTLVIFLIPGLWFSFWNTVAILQNQTPR